jgi:hypothetical protein
VPATTVAGRWASPAGLVGLSIVLGLAVLQIPTPLGGDQALAVVAGRTVLDGGGLYGSAGFWDIRPPFGFILHTAAVALPGDDAVGARLLELVWILATAALALRVVGARLRSTAAVVSVPLLVGGTYLASADPGRLGQPESFVGGPLLLAIWGVLPAEDGEDRRGRRVAAGAGAAVALLLKHPYAAIAVAAWTVAALRRPGLPAGPLRWFAPVLAGAAAVLLPVGAWLAATGDLGDALWTMAVYAPRAAGLGGREGSLLVELVKSAALLVGPSVIVAATALRRSPLDPLRAALLTWIVVGVPLVLVQHWWPYLPALLVVPTGLLAALAIDRVGDDRRWVGAFAVLLVLVPLRGVIRTGTDLLDHGMGLGADDRAALLRDDRAAVADAEAWVARLDEPGPVFVLGDPIGVVLADRTPGASVHGWSPEFYDEEVWARLVRQLEASRPVAIAVDEQYRLVVAERGQAFLDLLGRDYCRSGGAGTLTFWVPGPGGECPGG